jgi:excisionase family DNA binding protein
MPITLLTTKEVADELRISQRQVYALIREGTLPAVDLGHRTKRVRRAALDAYVTAREVKPCR